jgi:hypothetical protein
MFCGHRGPDICDVILHLGDILLSGQHHSRSSGPLTSLALIRNEAAVTCFYRYFGRRRGAGTANHAAERRATN